MSLLGQAIRVGLHSAFDDSMGLEFTQIVTDLVERISARLQIKCIQDRFKASGESPDLAKLLLETKILEIVADHFQMQKIRPFS